MVDRLLTVRDVMAEPPANLKLDDPVYQALDQLIAKGVAGIPVVDENGKLAGFLTEKDCLRIQAVSHQYNMTGSKVRDFMSDIKAPLHPDMDLLTATSYFLNSNFSVLPVMEGDVMVGSVSRQNMLNGIQRMHRNKGRGIELDRKAVARVMNPSGIENLQGLVNMSNREQLVSVLHARHLED